jgi:outer membrane murein-binding lipoprotein Lpp
VSTKELAGTWMHPIQHPNLEPTRRTEDGVRDPCTNFVDRSYFELSLKGGSVMNEHDRSNQLMTWTMIVVGLVVFGSVYMVLSSGNPLPSKLQAEVPKAKVEVPSAAVAGLEKRVVQLESGMKAPPIVNTSQLEAQLKGLESQLRAVQTQLGTFRGSDFDALRTKIDSAGKENSESVKTMIDALRTDVGTLHTRVDQLSQQATSATAPELKPDLKQSSQKSQHSKSK